MSRARNNQTDTTAVGAVTTSRDSEYTRAQQWRDATREMVLAAATATATTDQPQSQGSISIALIGTSQSIDLMLADTGDIVLTSLGDTDGSHPMNVIPMRLDMLSDPPAICLRGRGLTQPTRLRLVVELTARDPHKDTTLVMTCEYDSVRLDAQTPLAQLDFQLHQGDLLY
jgi:hypothetical protein